MLLGLKNVFRLYLQQFDFQFISNFFTLLTFIYIVLGLTLVHENFCAKVEELYMPGKVYLAC